MTLEHSLARLLGLLLDLPDDSPVYATRSFQPWLDGGVTVWPTTRKSGGLWLVDTRDRSWRRVLRTIGHGDDGIDNVALVLARSTTTRFSLSSLLRSFGRGRSRRLEAAVYRALGEGHPCPIKIGFHDDDESPTSFDLTARNATSGTALLFSPGIHFPAGAAWEHVLQALRDPRPLPLQLHLRDRGAAVLMVRSRGQDMVVRIIPNGDLQQVVDRNHHVLTDLRHILGPDHELLRLIPEPRFRRTTSRALLLGETRLPGTLAWKLSRGGRARTIYHQALSFLDQFRKATLRQKPLSSTDVANILAEDDRRARRAGEIYPAVRSALVKIFQNAPRVTGGRIRGYASHGDFGYGNILIEPHGGRLSGVIDWDTGRLIDIPGADRVNLEIQIRRTAGFQNLEDAVRDAWSDSELRGSLNAEGPALEHVLFALAVCRYISRALRYPHIFRQEQDGFRAALEWIEELTADSLSAA